MAPGTFSINPNGIGLGQDVLLRLPDGDYDIQAAIVQMKATSQTAARHIKFIPSLIFTGLKNWKKIPEYGIISHMEDPNSRRGFDGLRVLTLESRRAPEMAKLIANYGGKPMVAPAMREIPLESNAAALDFGRKLLEGQFDSIIFLTGVGTRALSRVVETIYSHDEFLGALRKIHIIARGPKPMAVLKEWEVPIILAAPEPNTWHEILRAIDENSQAVPLQGRRVAVQEYGVSNPDLLAGLAERGAQVTSIPVYEWGLPEDVGPLRAAVEAIARREIDVVLFTTAMQVNHLLQIATEMNEEENVRVALPRTLVASIGPTTSERLREYEISVDIEPSRPKMGYLVSETAQQCAGILRRKRTPAD